MCAIFRLMDECGAEEAVHLLTKERLEEEEGRIGSPSGGYY